VYVIEAGDGTLYTGITTDLARRWQQHASGRGARYLRGRELRAVVFAEAGHDRASASRREAAIKKLSRPEKLALIGERDQAALRALFEVKKQPPAIAGGERVET
jgi:putative endonuclease